MPKNVRIGLEIAKLHRVASRQFERKIISVIDEDISLSQARIIMFIGDFGSDGCIFQKDIEQALSLTGPSVSLSINHMEQKGYVTRVKSDKDARHKQIELTNKAISLYNDIFSVMTEVNHKLTKDLSENELETFLSVCEKIRKAIIED